MPKESVEVCDDLYEGIRVRVIPSVIRVGDLLELQVIHST